MPTRSAVTIHLRSCWSKLLLVPALCVAWGSSQAQAPDLTGIWQGTLNAGGHAIRLMLKISNDNGSLKAILYSIDQPAPPIPATSITEQGSAVKLTVVQIGLTYTGAVSGDALTGTWAQGSQSLPLTFAHVKPEAAWAIPEPAPRVPPMAANADPAFEVATIKPSKPDQQGKVFTIRGTRVLLINTTVEDMIKFAYGLNARQIGSAPAWMQTDHFDVTGQPDVPGTPNVKQMRTLVQKLLADRFQLKFHYDRKELSVYALAPGKGPVKLTKSTATSDLPGLFFRNFGELTVQNATMTDFTQLLQGSVLDRPVVDQSGLAGRFDFVLNWTPDDSQFAGMGMKAPATDKPDAAPPLFTAIQEQLGLRLEATRAMAQVFAIDHVEKPSEN